MDQRNSPSEKSEIAVGLRREAANFLKIAKENELRAASLFQAAAILEGREIQIEIPFSGESAKPSRPRAPKGSRKDQVRSLLNLAGPLTRHEIIVQTGVPKGTLDHILNLKNGFERLPSGAWRSLIEPGQVEETAEEKLGI